MVRWIHIVAIMFVPAGSRQTLERVMNFLENKAVQSLLSKINGTGTRDVDFMRLAGSQKGILEDLPSNVF